MAARKASAVGAGTAGVFPGRSPRARSPRRWRLAARQSAPSHHPFICKVFEVGEDAGALFIVMEYVRGETLFARLRAGRMSLAEALRIAGEMTEALEEAHAAGGAGRVPARSDQKNCHIEKWQGARKSCHRASLETLPGSRAA